MRREILFRAKHTHVLPENVHLDGKWVEGYLCDKNYIYSTSLEGEFLIDPETVCQYIGLTDKNGRKIFEGDIVKSDLNKSGKIVFNESHMAFTILEKEENRYYYIEECDGDHIEVIGKVFDNPEMLKGERKR